MKTKFALILLVGLGLALLFVSQSNLVIAQTNTPAPVAPVVTPTPAGEIVVPAFTIPIFTPGSNPLMNRPDTSNRVAGVFLGIWHGVISPITLIVSFINPNIQMYEVHNDGSPYNLGFLFGVALVFFLLGVTGGSRRRR